MGFIVKNTTFCSPLDLLCPHTCINCGALGKFLCDCCKNDILADHANFCPACKHPVFNASCAYCQLAPSVMVDWRDGVVGRMIQEYKYHSVRAAGKVLAELLDAILPRIDEKVVIVPLPTIQKHVRARGFDHTYKIAAMVAKWRGWKVERLLARASDTVQVGADRDWRLVQAAKAYELVREVDPETTYVLLDDVWTTGASMKAALKKLQRAGVSKSIIAVLAVSRA